MITTGFMREILRSLLIVGIVGSIAIGITNAYFSDTETSTGNVLGAGAIDLKINDEDNPEAIVNLTDLKPGDNQIVEKRLRVIDNPANVWMHLISYETEQGVQTEPELLEEDGTPKHDIDNYLNYDLLVGENPIITLENEIPFPDVFSCWIPLGEFPGDEEVIVEQSFHFDESVTNWAQGDLLTFTEEFFAQQSRNDSPPPVSESGRVWDPDSKRCVEGDNLLWIIGDVEADQLDIPVDELNWPGVFGVFPNPPAIGDDYTRIITAPVDDTADLEFPWNTNYNVNYARNINIDFNYAGPAITAKLSVGWSPGRSANEQKEIFLDAVSLGLTPLYLGASTAGWWEQMPRYIDEFTFALSPGPHTIRIEHQFGDGTLWDFIKLEKM